MGSPPEPAPTVAGPDAMSYTEPDDLRTLRGFVAARASALGLPEERADLLTLAVTELATNTLQHTTGGGHVRVWSEDSQLICDVVDGGPMRDFGRHMPASDALRGRGLAIVEQVCDEVAAFAVPEGTLVRIRLHL